MASNTRGKLKEELEGMHRNFDWLSHHGLKAVKLIGEHKPKLTEALMALVEQIAVLDKLTQDIYHNI